MEFQNKEEPEMADNPNATTPPPDDHPKSEVVKHKEPAPAKVREPRKGKNKAASSADTAPARTREMERAGGEISKEGEEARKNAEEAVAERAAQAAATDGRAALAARERMAAARRADANATDAAQEGKGTTRMAHRQSTSARYTALHAMVRDGHSVHPGEPISFRSDEALHVQELLAQGMIAEGTDADAERALRDADLARAEAVGPTSAW